MLNVNQLCIQYSADTSMCTKQRWDAWALAAAARASLPPAAQLGCMGDGQHMRWYKGCQFSSKSGWIGHGEAQVSHAEFLMGIQFKHC